MEQKRNKMEIADYHNLVREHRWTFEVQQSETSYYDFIRRARREAELIQIATANGPWFVDSFFDAQKRAMSRYVEPIANRIRDEADSRLKNLVPTGDEEFDKYRQMVVNHDWYYDYSDDISVWRSGSERRKQLETIAKEKGGMYQTYFDFYKNLAYNPKKGEKS